MDKIDAVRQWRETGVIADGCHGAANYFGFQSISVDELNEICDQLNAEWEAQDSGLRIGWSAGEFRPGFKRQRDLPLGEAA